MGGVGEGTRRYLTRVLVTVFCETVATVCRFQRHLLTQSAVARISMITALLSVQETSFFGKMWLETYRPFTVNHHTKSNVVRTSFVTRVYWTYFRKVIRKCNNSKEGERLLVVVSNSQYSSSKQLSKAIPAYLFT